MPQDDSFAQLMVRLKDGDEAAAAEIFGRFIYRLIALASHQFDSLLRHRVDLEGVVQSAYKSFFVSHGRGQFELAAWEDLWGLLAVITLRKCYRRRDYLMAERRSVTREVSCGPPRGDEESIAPWLEAIDREPTPLEAAMLTETLEQLLENLERPEREIIELSLQGHTTPEIAARLGRSRRTVRRVRERVKDSLLRLQNDDEDRNQVEAEIGAEGPPPGDPGRPEEDPV